MAPAVTSVLAPGSAIHSGNGAKQIDVIARYIRYNPYIYPGIRLVSYLGIVKEF